MNLSQLKEIWRAVGGACATQGLKYTSEFIFRAVDKTDPSVVYYSDSDLTAKVLQTKAVQDILNKWIREYKTSNKKSFSDTITFTSSNSSNDLYLSIHKASIGGNISSNGYLNFTIYDNYNFEHWDYSKAETLKQLGVTAINNFADWSEARSALRPFGIFINCDYYVG